MDLFFLLINRFNFQIYILKKYFFIKITKVFLNFKKNYKYNDYDLTFLKDGRIEIGNSLVKGNYVFASVNLSLKESNIFKNDYPSQEVQKSILGFDWLNDLSVLGNAKARKTANNWLSLWLGNYSFEKECKREINIIAQRQINFVHNITFIEKIFSEKKFQSILRKIYAEKIFLNFLLNDLEDNFLKFKILNSSFWLEVFLSSNISKRNQYFQKICEIIMLLINKKLFLESRKPEELLEIFLIISDLINNTENKFFRKNKSRKKIILIQKKLVPILRGLRLGNGSLARFHGGDAGNIELIDKALSSVENKEEGVSSNPLGIERITAGRLILLLDCHSPPLNNFSLDSHASCLSFELSSGQRPIFVNCGPGGRFGIEYKRFCRNTSAHNTSSIDNKSQVEFRSIFTNEEFSKEIIFKGPKKVNINRGKSIDAKWLEGSHDGYNEKYGILHKRKIILLKSGNTISGSDFYTKKSKLFLNFDLSVETYFHLHPNVEITNQPHINSIILRLLNGEHWIFETKIGRPIVKESIYVDSNHFKPLNTKVIILKSKILEKNLLVNWSLRRREIVSRHTRDIEIFKK